jgi:hypothetical protein
LRLCVEFLFEGAADGRGHGIIGHQSFLHDQPSKSIFVSLSFEFFQ